MIQKSIYRLLIFENKPNIINNLSDFPAVTDVAKSIKEAMLHIDYYTYDLIFLPEEFTDPKNNITSYISNSFLNNYTPIVACSEKNQVNNLLIKICHRR
ncbi:MAG: hypothetical protein HC906_04760 [Bacteroidales bacterium]|nr:hypothetical protein [Bacteroidales bacterium]